LSQQILNLEEELGQQLFHRLGRKAVLTEAGQTLVEGARRIIGDVDQTLHEIKESSDRGPKVTVGAIPTVASFLFPALIAHCRASEILLDIHTQEDFRRPLTEAVLEGKLDCALISLPYNEPRLHVVKLYREPLLVAMSANHPLAKVEKLGFESLRDENFILLGEASTLTLQIQHFCGENDFEPRIAHRCGQLATAKTLTAMGLGITVLPKSARSATDPEGLIFRKFSGPVQPARDIALVRHRRRHVSQGTQLFAEIARAVVGPISESSLTASPIKPSTPAT
jgi:LysR family hydrogen peroxide-inducible transcriptional activator